jgi:ribonuclease PH
MNQPPSRPDQRSPKELRPIKITPGVLDHAEGSALIEFGQTRVLCSVTYDEQGPKWLQGTGQGWVTAEYGMLPRSTHSRVKREKVASSGRTQEISRLIGRSLRAAIDLKKLGEKQLVVDCDVINADGGTRTAAITGGFVALCLSLKKLFDLSEIRELPFKNYVSAVSVGLNHGHPLLDLSYEEDVSIGADINFVMNDAEQFVEIQGTAEHELFSSKGFLSAMEIANHGCQQLFKEQAKIVGHLFPLKNRS